MTGLLALLGAFVAIGGFGMFVFDPLVTNDPYAAPMVATIGDGVDEFSSKAGAVLDAVIPTDVGGWVASIAVFVTIWSVIKVIRELRGPMRGPGDAGSLTSHIASTTMVALGVRSPAVPWGTVRDAATGHPLPLARVHLVGADGAVLDACVADPMGRYGFRLGHAALVSHGYRARLEPRKSGYYPSGPGWIPMTAGAHHGIDIVMDRAGEGPVPIHVASHSRLGDTAGVVAFWLGVLLVPLAFLQNPDLLHGMMFAAFVGAGVVRATWRHPKRQ